MMGKFIFIFCVFLILLSYFMWFLIGFMFRVIILVLCLVNFFLSVVVWLSLVV